jgi:hypothetical protein
MKEALRLHEQGVNAHRAALQAGVLPSSFYRLLGKLKADAASQASSPLSPAPRRP